MNEGAEILKNKESLLMNDTKYSPGTSEREDLMDGSLRSVMSYIALLAKSWKLNPLQRTLAIISAVSSLFC